jgi:tRNA nucleotidyltransferase/poly(A) polymerase
LFNEIGSQALGENVRDLVVGVGPFDVDVVLSDEVVDEIKRPR